MNSSASQRVPTEFRFLYGGFPNGYRGVVLRNGLLELIPLTHQPDGATGSEVMATVDDWSKFGNLLADLGVFEWRRSYDDPYIMDGTQWELNIDWPGRGRVRSVGNNAYPQELPQFLDAVSALIGENFPTVS